MTEQMDIPEGMLASEEPTQEQQKSVRRKEWQKENTIH